jgi:hypothetical protein
VDLILHAGDIYTHACIEWLERIFAVALLLGLCLVAAGPSTTPCSTAVT